MNNEKLITLSKYLEDLKNRLSGAVPPKHANHPETYKNFLRNEISAANKKLEEIKLSAAGSK
jgi:hypothetical protein